MIPKYEDMDYINSISAQLAQKLSVLYDRIVELEIELQKYKRMYCREVCKQMYSTGAKWTIRPNPMRSDGVFIEEDCEPGQNRTHFPFMHQFAHDDAKEIVFLLNRATDEIQNNKL
jgi:hypothetical protein